MNLTLKKIDAASPDLPELDRINRASFPASELLPTETLLQMGTLPGSDLLGIYADASLIGYGNTIYDKNCIYLSHFCIAPELRGQGCGSAALQAFADKYAPRQLILDLEPPEEPGAPNPEQRCKRVAFYERNGLQLNEWYTRFRGGIYFQVMSCGPLDVENFRTLLKRRICRVNTEIPPMLYPDPRPRCQYAFLGDPLYLQYHDEEWGRPVHDDAKLYEMFVLELFQAGLSWRTLLHKRENFRRAYDGFDLEKVCAYGEEDVERLMSDAGIIRSRSKIEASIQNSRIFRAIVQEYGSFDAYLWSYTDGKVLQIPGDVTRNEISDAMSDDLKRRGMKFCGSVTIYSYLQAVGVINSHEPGCFLNGEIF